MAEQSAAVILAAGKSTRMKTDLPKVLHEICGKPMLQFVLDACRGAGVQKLVVVVGHGKDKVIEEFKGQEDITWVEQKEQLGTGHALLCCKEALEGFTGNVLVIAGDMPLIQSDTLKKLLEARSDSGHGVTLATTILNDPTGYGRIIRDEEDNLVAIVEERDCTPEQRDICEVNPSYYCFDGSRMIAALDQITPNNVKGEYYITDAVSILREAGHGASAIEAVPAEDATGINARVDLAEVTGVMQMRIQLAHMDHGVTIVDPSSTWISAGCEIGRDTVLCPFSYVGCDARIGEGCRIGPFANIVDGEKLTDGSTVGPAKKLGAS